jgi:hypothetical protein
MPTGLSPQEEDSVLVEQLPTCDQLGHNVHPTICHINSMHVDAIDMTDSG